MSRDQICSQIASKVCHWELSNSRALGRSDGECYFGAYAALEETYLRGMDRYEQQSVWPRFTMIEGRMTE